MLVPLSTQVAADDPIEERQIAKAHRTNDQELNQLL